MNEQQRLVVALSLCLGIFFVFHALTPSPPSPTAAVPAPAVAPAAGEPPAQPSPVMAGPPQPPPVGTAIERRPLPTSWANVEVTSHQAALSRLDLRAFAEQGGDPARPAPPLQLAGEVGAGGLQAQILVAGVDGLPWSFAAAPPGSQQLVAEVAGSWELALTITPRQATPYVLDYTLTARNRAAGAQTLAWGMNLALRRAAQQPGLFAGNKVFDFGDRAGPLGLVVQANDKRSRRDFAQVEKKPAFWAGRVPFAAIDRQYFVIAALADGDGFASCRPQVQDGETLQVALTLPQVWVAAADQVQQHIAVYAGPKRDQELQQVAAGLREVVDYDVMWLPLGALARPMVFLLGHLHRLTHSWGIAISLLTLLVKILVFPVAYKSAVAMRRMQALKPRMDALKKTWEHDPERSQQEQMKMLRDNGANPLGGCLPALLQMPIWFALYRMLHSAVDLYRQPFLWLPDLTLPEPLPVLAIVVGALTLVQQKLTPMSADNPQAKIMLVVVPVVFTGFMFAMPSGLVVYILVNSVLTIIQQLAINRFVGGDDRVLSTRSTIS